MPHIDPTIRVYVFCNYTFDCSASALLRVLCVSLLVLALALVLACIGARQKYKILTPMSTLKRRSSVSISYDLYHCVAARVRVRVPVPVHTTRLTSAVSIHTHTHALSVLARICAMCMYRALAQRGYDVLSHSMSTSTYIRSVRCEVRQKCVCSNWNVHKYRICDLSDGVFLLATPLLNVMLMLQRQICTQRSNTKNSAATAAAAPALFTYDPKRPTYISITLYALQHILQLTFCFSVQREFGLALFIRFTNRVRALPTSTASTVHALHRGIKQQNRK